MDTLKTIALSYAIFRVYGNKYLKYDEFDAEHTFCRRSNKSILQSILYPQSNKTDSENTEILSVDIIDLDITAASEIIKYFRKISFKILGETASDFMSAVFRVTQSKTILKEDLSIISLLPKIYHESLQKDSIKQIIKSTSGEYIGTIGNQIQVTCILIETHYVDHFNCFSHLAITKDNALISWLNKSQAGFENDCIHIKGRVKSHGTNFLTDKPETKLHYVKYF